MTEAEDEGKHEEDGAGDGDGERNEDLYAGNIVAMRRERRRITSPCARDLVAECRRCAKVVCRVSFFFCVLVWDVFCFFWLVGEFVLWLASLLAFNTACLS